MRRTSLLAALVLAVSAQGAPPARETEFLVQFRKGTPAPRRRACCAALGRTLLDFRSAKGGGIFDDLVLVRAGAGQTAASIRASDGCIAHVEENLPCEDLSVPNDPRFAEQWAAPKMRLPEAWDLSTGDPALVVAVVDKGADWRHPDLAGAIWTNPLEIAGNGLDDDRNGYVDDVRGWDFYGADADPYPSDGNAHGTHVAGIVAATGNNATGIAGVGWSLRVMPLRASFDNARILSAFQYAIANGARVINCSFRTSSSSLHRQAIQQAVAAGIVVVGGAGNDGLQSLVYPAAYPEVISVGATSPTDQKAMFSNYSAALTLCAPGTDILSTVIGGGYEAWNGTSMSAPQVSGLSALLLARGAPAGEVRALLRNGADPIDALNTVYAGLLGGGRANAYWSLRGVGDSVPPSGAALTGYAATGNSVTLSGVAASDDVKVAGYRVELSQDGVAFQVHPGVHKSLPAKVGGLLPSQAYFFRVTPYDVRGNLGPVSNVLAAATVANRPPDAPSASGALFTSAGTAERFLVAASDPDGDRVRYYLDWGDGRTDASTTPVLPDSPLAFTHAWAEQGRYTVSIRSGDDLGMGPATVFTVTVARAGALPPERPVLSGPAWLQPDVDGKFSAVSGGVGPLTYVFSWGDGSSFTSEESKPGTPVARGHAWPAGAYALSVRAVDEETLASSLSAPLALTVSVNPPVPIGNLPPLPCAVSGPAQVRPGDPATFTAVADDETALALQYWFAWTDAGLTSTGWVPPGTPASMTRSWKAPGVYTAYVFAFDGQAASPPSIFTVTVRDSLAKVPPGPEPVSAADPE